MLTVETNFSQCIHTLIWSNASVSGKSCITLEVHPDFLGQTLGGGRTAKKRRQGYAGRCSAGRITVSVALTKYYMTVRLFGLCVYVHIRCWLECLGYLTTSIVVSIENKLCSFTECFVYYIQRSRSQHTAATWRHVHTQIHVPLGRANITKIRQE